jgi:hypothetical protein
MRTAQRRGPYTGPNFVRVHLPTAGELETALSALRELVGAKNAPDSVPLGEWAAKLRGMGLAGGPLAEIWRELERMSRITINDGRVRLGR